MVKKSQIQPIKKNMYNSDSDSDSDSFGGSYKPKYRIEPNRKYYKSDSWSESESSSTESFTSEQYSETETESYYTSDDE